MKIGCCANVFDDRVFSLAGTAVDYVETGLAQLAEHTREEIASRGNRLREAGLSCQAANLLFPGGLRLTGKDADHRAAAVYLEDALDKASLLGIRTCVFGSGAARSIPEGFPREEGWEQLYSLCAEVIVPAFSKRGMVCCAEPLNSRECNVLNTCAETAVLVRRVGSENFRLLCDLYHFDLEGEARESLENYGDVLRHIHIASAKNGREFPRPGDGEDYGSFFRELRAIGYGGGISLEGAVTGELKDCAHRSAAYLKTFSE